MSEDAVLTECERGEDVAKSAYEDALKKDLPAECVRWWSANTRA